MTEISVIVTSYNQRSWLREALDSVMVQSLAPCEILIVDDGSSDGSRELIQGYAAKHPRLVRPLLLPRNRGVAQARNAALEKARGELITTLDGDDRYTPSKLAQELSALQRHPRARLACSNLRFFGDAVEPWLWLDDEDAAPQGQVFQRTVERDFPKHLFFRFELVAIEALRAVGFYDPALALWEDWDLAIRLTHRFELATCPAVGVEVRRHGRGLSSADALAHYRALRRVYQKTLPLLDELEPAAKRQLRASQRRRLGKVGRRAARQALAESGRGKALGLWLDSLRYRLPGRADRDFLSRLLIPFGTPTRQGSQGEENGDESG